MEEPMEAVDPPFLITELEGEVYSQTGRTVDMALADLLSLTTEWVETERILITATVDLVAEARVVMDFPAGGADIPADPAKMDHLLLMVADPTIRAPIKATPPERTKATERSSLPRTLPQATRVSLQ